MIFKLSLVQPFSYEITIISNLGQNLGNYNR